MKITWLSRDASARSNIEWKIPESSMKSEMAIPVDERHNTVEKINNDYSGFYSSRTPRYVYPTEMVVRTFLATYPKLQFKEKPTAGSRVLDVGFGDGRNTVFLCQQGFEVHGIEITDQIVELGRCRMQSVGVEADLRVGRNNSIPYADEFFDCLLCCHSCYYCDPGESFQRNLAEFSRVLKPGGWFVGSVPDAGSYIFDGGKKGEDGCIEITSDPYNARNGYRLKAFSSPEEIEEEFSQEFSDFSFAFAGNDYYGIYEKVHWVVCRKK